MHAVICRYNETLDWVNDLTIPYTVYNKGKNNLHIPFIQAENIGRESETFIKFILQNYENLPNEVVFLQGNPFNHLPIVLDEIKRYKSNTILGLSDTFKIDNIEGCPCECGLPIASYLKNYIPLLNKEYFMFATGAQYIVPKGSILSKPKEWWEVLYRSHYIEIRTPWILERLWFEIFNLNLIESNE